MKIKFENHSVSGIFREYAGFILNVPGHAIGNKAVIANVPDELVDDVKRHLAANHPAIIMTVEGEGAEPAVITTEDAAEPEAGLEPEPTSEAVEPIEDGQGEEAEPAHRRGGKRGGK